MRRLIYIPIIHTEADMGSLAGSLKEQFTHKHGAKLWNQRAKTVEELWDGIERKIDALKINFKKTKVYQDGLPICGKERDIVSQLAKNGSRNHIIVKKLLRKGATLIGTEDIKILLQEYNFIKEIVNRKSSILEPISLWFLKRKGKDLLVRRDQFIAKRIDATLKPSETGIVFIGLVHKLHQCLSKDIKVDYLP